MSMQICIHTYILATPQTINITMSKSTNPPPMIPMTAPMGSSSSNFLISGVTVALGITADDVTEVAVVEDIVIVTTIMRKRVSNNQ